MTGASRQRTEALLDQVLTTADGTLRAVTVEPGRRGVLLLVDDLLLRVEVSRTNQALALQAQQHQARTTLDGATVLADGRVLLAFDDGEHLLPLVADAVTHVHA